jgi:hypothetical protein
MPVYIRTDWEGTQKVFPFVCFFRPLVEGKTQNRQWNQQNHYKVYIVGGGGRYKLVLGILPRSHQSSVIEPFYFTSNRRKFLPFVNAQLIPIN